MPVWNDLGPGAPVVLIGFHVSVFGLYRPPLLVSPMLSPPPQMIISLPVQTAVCEDRPVGAFTTLIGRQVSVLGLYRPPVFVAGREMPIPPQTIISLPVQTAV